MQKETTTALIRSKADSVSREVVTMNATRNDNGGNMTQQLTAQPAGRDPGSKNETSATEHKADTDSVSPEVVTLASK